MTYAAHLVVLASIYAVLAASLNLVAGYGGLVSLGHAAFFGIGAYVTAILLTSLGWNFWIAGLSAFLLAWLIGSAVGIVFTRVRGDYFVLATLALQMVVSGLFLNWQSVTSGPYGITGIPAPTFANVALSSPTAYLPLALAVSVAVFWYLKMLVGSPFGRLLQAGRDDSVAAEALGKNVAEARRRAFAIAAGAAASAGALYASYMRFIDPGSFSLPESIFVLTAVVVGGTATLWGPFAGAAVLVILPELLRLTSLPDAVAAALRQIAYGAALIAIIRLRPAGLLGHEERSF